MLTSALGAVMLLTCLPAESAPAASLGARAVQAAASKKGTPYRWGATGPRHFDCSGLTLYAYKRAGRTIPRTAAAQHHHSRRISPSARRQGDLVFFHTGNTVYHVGLYAGHNRIWHSPKPGRTVRRERLWTSRVWYGRVA